LALIDEALLANIRQGLSFLSIKEREISPLLAGAGEDHAINAEKAKREKIIRKR
jgi:hypothetical protein